jgi:hypothetical protein
LVSDFANADFGFRFSKRRFWFLISQTQILVFGLANADFGFRFSKRRFWFSVSQSQIPEVVLANSDSEQPHHNDAETESERDTRPQG